MGGIDGSQSDPVLTGPRIVIVDEKPLIREAMKIGLEEYNVSVVGCSEPGAGATANVLRERPDVVVVGDGVSGAGLLYARDLKATAPAVRVVLFGSAAVRADATHLEGLGLNAVIGKHLGLAAFAEVIDAVANGLPPRAQLAAPAPPPAPEADRVVQLMASTLTRREREVLELLAAGATSDQLAEELSLSPHTVRTHIQNAMSKLQVHSRLEAATFAVRHGIVVAPRREELAG
jgi:two-component system nitrate/nitrite response regulator NarL